MIMSCDTHVMSCDSLLISLVDAGLFLLNTDDVKMVFPHKFFCLDIHIRHTVLPAENIHNTPIKVSVLYLMSSDVGLHQLVFL